MRWIGPLFFLLTAPLFSMGEYWTTQALKKELAPSWKFEWQTQARLRGGGEGPYLFYSQYLLIHTLKENWALGAGLRSHWVKREGKWEEQQLPIFECGRLFELGRARFSFRERVQCHLNYNHFTARTRLMLHLPLTERVGFFLIDEIFLRNGTRYQENRIEWMVGFRPKKRVYLGAGYLLKSRERELDNILRTVAEFTF